jgi:predicted permease
MSTPTPSRLPRWIYRCLLVLAPRAVRRVYGPDMLATFAALYDAAAAKGWRAVCRLLAHEAAEMWKARGAGRLEVASASRAAYHPTTPARGAAETLLTDLRYAMRALRRDAAWTTLAIAIVGLGVGASAAVFSVVHALLLRPLPFAEPGRLAWIANGTSDNLSAQTVQVSHLLDLRQQSRAFSDIAGFSPFYGVGDVRLTGVGEPERLTAVPVTDGFFTLLGVEPRVGRFFTAAEAAWQAPKTVVLAHAYWQRRFAGHPDVVGRTIMLDGAPATIVGVLPDTFEFAATFTPGSPADLFVPFPLSPETDREGNTLALIGRLNPGVNLTAAQAEATMLADEIGRSLGQTRNRFRPNLSPLRERVSGPFEHSVLVLAGAVAFLMLIVCANLSNLLLVRASARQQELAVRAALGAQRHQLVRQMVVESLVLAGAGASLGLALAVGGTSMIARLDDTGIPLLQNVRVDGVVLAFTALAATVTGLGFGLLPALRMSAAAPQVTLRERSRGSIGMSHSWMQRAIVVGEIALVCVLLTGAGLLVRSLRQVLDVQPGFDPDSMLALRVDPVGADLTIEQKNAYFDEIVRHARSVPGVDAVGLTDALPLGDNFGWRTWDASATPVVERGQRQFPLVRMIDDGYFAAMKIALRAGRGFTLADGPSGERVVIINDTLARALWPGQDPLGRIVWTSNGRVARRVIGVVGDVRYFALERATGAEMYMPLRQTGNYHVVDLVVRTALPVASIAPGLRRALSSADPNLPAGEFRTMEQLVDDSVFARRFIVMLTGGFAAFGLLLAAMGIYAVIAYSVNQRRREIGIRLALGASPRALRLGVLSQSVTLALVGLAIGIPASWMATRSIRGLLFGIVPTDSVTFAAALALLVAVAAVAGYLPARRASRIDPMAALRAD